MFWIESWLLQRQRTQSMADPSHYHVQARSVRLVGLRRRRQNEHRYEIVVATPADAWKEGEAMIGLAVLDTAVITNRARISTLQQGGTVRLVTSRLTEPRTHEGAPFRV